MPAGDPGLDGRVAVVTGASAGIGRAYALALAGAGATVVAAARTVSDGGEAPGRGSLAEVVRAAGGLRGSVHAHRCDVEVESDVADLVAGTVGRFGRIDVLVNNAGVYPHHDSLAIAAEEWDRVMRVNVRAPYLAIRSAAPHMIRQGSGSIVTLTSLSAVPTGPASAHRDLLAYAVSKAAVDRLTTHLAVDLAPHGIAVNALSPGAVLTDSFIATDPEVALSARASGWGKPATPEVMGPPLLFLARQSAATFTGRVVHHDEFGTTWGG